MNKYLKSLKPVNNNWVHKILNQRRQKPVYIAVFITLCIVGYFYYEEYSNYRVYSDRNERIQADIDLSEKRLKNLDKLINSGKNKLTEINNQKIDNKQPVAFMSKVCDLLKNREMIGAYYIYKKQNPKYSNVLNLEIKVSYGDIDLLFLVTKIVMEKVFYLKSIEQTENGVKWELYKPQEEDKK
jgi:hypothetical protein